jgi:hypothetical protein
MLMLSKCTPQLNQCQANDRISFDFFPGWVYSFSDGQETDRPTDGQTTRASVPAAADDSYG